MAYHEAGHALVARNFGARVKSVLFFPGGGAVVREPFEPGETPEELERDLVIAFAGREAERHAPPISSWDDPWFTEGELALLPLPESVTRTADETADETFRLPEDAPSDADVIARETERLGPEAAESAREFAAELVDRFYRTGKLERLAQEIFVCGRLSADDLDRVLGARA